MNRKLFLCDEDYKRELYHRQSKLDPDYDEVESVVYNSLHERVDVLCKYTERRYTSFSQREWNYEKKRTKMEQPVRIYLVFGREGNELLLGKLRECKNFEERYCREL